MNRKREAIEAEPDPVAEIQKHLNMVEEDKYKMQKYLNDKKAYSDKLHLMVIVLHRYWLVIGFAPKILLQWVARL